MGSDASSGSLFLVRFKAGAVTGVILRDISLFCATTGAGLSSLLSSDSNLYDVRLILRCTRDRGDVVAVVLATDGAGVDTLTGVCDEAGVAGSPVSVSPFICNASAVLINVGNASCFTLTSPQYMN